MTKRVAAAWCVFMKHKLVLCNRRLSVHGRVRLFDTIVTPCILYGCGVWTMTVESERLLRTTRRRMLRWMMAARRGPDETWVEYIRRATHQSEERAASCGGRDWVQLQRTRKFKLAGKTAMQTDGRWNKRLLSWIPWFRASPHRNVGRPCKRWDDDIVHLAGGDWPSAAADPVVWEALRLHYVEQA